MSRRVHELFRRGGPALDRDNLLSEAFEELEIALEMLHAAVEAQHRQHEAWLDERVALATAILRYQDLFNQAPIGYLVTSLDGSIRQANSMAVALLQTEARQLVGRSLSLFVPEGQRRAFRAEVARLRDIRHLYTWEAELQPWNGTSIAAELIVSVARGEKGRPRALHWLVHGIQRRKREEQQLRARVAELEQRLQRYEEAPLAERAVAAD